jgi:hypothetical protein
MNLRNNKGQMGPMGEDLIHILIVGFAIAFILIVTVKAFTDYTETYQRLDTYRMGLALAEKASNDYAWAPDGVKRMHILNSTKLDEGLECTDIVSLCVIDGNDNKKWACPNAACNGVTASDGEVSVVSIPVTIRIDEKNYHPGILEVTQIYK